MIQTLQIRNLALVENVRIEFGAGMNVITGETGAGKSILIGALGLALGDRADREMIRSGEEFCSVEAAFCLRDPKAVNGLLDESGIPSCENGELIIRRIVAASGAGRILVNDTSITLQALKRIGDLLVDIHGPHDHQSLIKGDFQLAALDDYGALNKERASFAELYRKARELEDKKNELLAGGEDAAARRIDTLEFQVKEIEAAELQLDEEEAVLREHAVLGNSQRILELTQTIISALAEDESSAFSDMVTVQQALGELVPLMEKAQVWKNEARSIAVQTQELAADISGFVQGIDQDPARLQWLDERLATYRKLKRKYGNTVEDVLTHLRQSKEMLNELLARAERINEIEVELAGAHAAMSKIGVKLRAARNEVAKRLSGAVARELRALGFGQSVFAISIREAEPNLSGMDEVEFQFAPNKGEAMRLLSVIASSGEISRVMLALKSVLADQDAVPTLVFDEVDMNIGGTTASAVGLKLAGLAEKRQLLCITHLPQVAIHGTTHFSVAKEERKGRTVTGISPVEKEARVEEIARMLGGRDSTAVALRHARELLKKANPA